MVNYAHLCIVIFTSKSSFALAEIVGLENWRSMTREQAVDSLLDSVDPVLTVLPGEWIETVRQTRKKRLIFRDGELALSFQRQRNQERQANRRAFKQWWVDQILAGNSPVAERLLLFWHNLYATELKSLTRPQLLWWQHISFRENLLGNYHKIVDAIVHDPAMLDYLDNDKNLKGNPNENFARELLELHTLGEGHYSEADIRELARALTGAGIDRAGNYNFYPDRHDTGRKTVLGHTSNIGPEDVAGLILRQSRTANYLVERLWREFVSSDPDLGVVDKLANNFRLSDYQIRPLIKALLLREEFWKKDNWNTMVQGPVEFLVDLHWRAGVELLPEHKAVNYLRRMGQDVFDPPDVAGWPGGISWIDSSGLLARNAYRNLVLTGRNKEKRAAHSSYLK